MDEKTQKNTPIKRLRAFLNRHRLAVILVAGVIAIGVIGNVALSLAGQPFAKIVPDIFVKPKPKPVYSLLTGLKVGSAADQTKPVTAIMIENSPDARPQSGLKQAEVVYEAIAEGGITRFVALYQQNKPTLIGPVRSVRPYYLDWIRPYDASVAHVGGSALALKQVRNGSWRDLDQFFNDGAYWRVSDRYAPHNVYTNFKKLDALNKAKKYTSSHPKEIVRADTKPPAKLTAQTVSVHISSALYDSSYSYSPKSGLYTRSQGGEVMQDREKGAITPKVIVVMTVKQHEVWEETWRESMETTGSGKAVIFQDGTATKVTWHKKSAADQLLFTDKNGKEFALARGQTWLTAIPPNGSVSWQP